MEENNEVHILKTQLMSESAKVAALVNDGATVVAHDGRPGPQTENAHGYASNDMPWTIRAIAEGYEVPDYAHHFIKTDLMISRAEVSVYVNATIPAVVHDGAIGRRPNGFEGELYAKDDKPWLVTLDMSKRVLPEEVRDGQEA